MRTAKTLISLGGCPGWSESSLGAHAILLVLPCGGAYIIECALICEDTGTRITENVTMFSSSCFFIGKIRKNSDTWNRCCNHPYIWTSNASKRWTNRVEPDQAAPSEMSVRKLRIITGARKLSRLVTKPTMWLCAQRRLKSGLASSQYNQSLRCSFKESLCP